jgi:prophage regulatory protein
MHRHENSALLSERLVSLTPVCESTGLSRSTIYRLIANGDFPKPVKISKGRVAWREREVLAWLASVH